jgi:hypothetical protein
LAQLQASVGAPRYVRQEKKSKLNRDIAGRTIEKLKKLPLCQFQRRVRHVVDESDDKGIGLRLLPSSARWGHSFPSWRSKSGKPAGGDLHRHGNSLFRREHGPLAGGCIQCLVEIRDDVVDMLDADAQANHFRPHTRLGLLLARHLTMGG